MPEVAQLVGLRLGSGVRGPGPAALTVAPEFFSAGILCSAVQLTRRSNEKDKTIKDKKIKELVSL